MKKKKKENDLCEIFNALKEHDDKKPVLYKKIDNVVSVNVYENPSFCSTLYVFKNGNSTPWLNLKLSSIKNSGLGVFSL